MLDIEFSKQSERRGRFIIQEIEEDEDLKDITPSKNNYYSDKLDKLNLLITNNNGNPNPHVNISKRPKHSSIIMDSKIIHTTRMDSNYYNETFSAFIYEENTKDWLDFGKIWNEFSKVHVDVIEDDMEKIFHYIDNKIDDSDFFYVNNLNELRLKTEKSEKSEDKIKINSENEPLIEKNVNKSNKTDSIEKKRKRKLKISNRSLILTNFCGPSIVSPAVSPINSSESEINNEDGHSETENKTYYSSIVNRKTKRSLTQNELNNKKLKVEVIDKNNNNKNKENYNEKLKVNKEFENNELKLKIVKNIQITLNYIKVKVSQNVNVICYDRQLQIHNSYQNGGNNEEEVDGICILCKNKL